MAVPLQIKHLSILQPFVLSCCYSSSSDLVMETFCTLQRILKDLTWYHSSSFIIKLTFTLAHFFEEVKPPRYQEVALLS